MSVIITATDFSDIADKAVNYACQMAEAHNASITVIHSFMIPVTFSDTPMPMLALDDMREIANKNMVDAMEKLRSSFPDLKITGKVLYGDIIDSLQEYTAEQEQPWMIVLGNSVSGENTVWVGSTILSALRNLKFPVLAIPPDATFRPIEKICLACDYTKITEKFPFDQISQIAMITRAELHVLHIDQQNKAWNDNSSTEILHSHLSGINPQYHFIGSIDTDDAIHDFVSTHHMDWLMIVPHKYSFFEGLFHKKHTTKLTRLSEIPLIALHEQE